MAILPQRIIATRHENHVPCPGNELLERDRYEQPQSMPYTYKTQLTYHFFFPLVAPVALPAAPFLASPPLRFRGIPDTLATSHLEGSECCLIHADNPLSAPQGVYLNPLVRVGYNGAAYDAVHPTRNWLSARRILQGLWINRLRRWTTTVWFKERTVRNRVARWMALGDRNREPGLFCVINEMQLLRPLGWAHA